MEEGAEEELARLEVEGVQSQGLAAGRDRAWPVALLEAERGQVGAVGRAPGVDRDGAPARGDGVARPSGQGGELRGADQGGLAIRLEGQGLLVGRQALRGTTEPAQH